MGFTDIMSFAGIPLSLWLGGYDQSRVIGPVSSQSYQGGGFAIDLLDVGIGVDNGASPFNFSAKQGILAQGNSCTCFRSLSSSSKYLLGATGQNTGGIIAPKTCHRTQCLPENGNADTENINSDRRSIYSSHPGLSVAVSSSSSVNL